MTTPTPPPASDRPVRPSLGWHRGKMPAGLREKRLVAKEQAANDALATIAMKFPMLSRRKLGIIYAGAYREALHRMREAGLISAYVPGEQPRYNKSASPRQILRLRSSAAKVESAE